MSSIRHDEYLTIGEVRKMIRTVLNEEDVSKDETYQLTIQNIKKHIDNWEQLSPAKKVDVVERAIVSLGEEKNISDIKHFFDTIVPKTDEQTIKVLANNVDLFRKYMEQKQTEKESDVKDVVKTQDAAKDIANDVEAVKTSGLKALFKDVIKNASEKRKLAKIESYVESFIDDFVKSYDEIAQFAEENFPNDADELMSAAVGKPISDEMKKRAASKNENVTRHAFKKELTEIRRAISLHDNRILEAGIFSSIANSFKANMASIAGAIGGAKDSVQLKRFQKNAADVIRNFVNGYSKLTRMVANEFPDKFEQILANLVEIPISRGISGKVSSHASAQSVSNQQQSVAVQNPQDDTTAAQQNDDKKSQVYEAVTEALENEEAYRKVFGYGDMIHEFIVTNLDDVTNSVEKTFEAYWKKSKGKLSVAKYWTLCVRKYIEESGELLQAFAEQNYDKNVTNPKSFLLSPSDLRARQRASRQKSRSSRKPL